MAAMVAIIVWGAAAWWFGIPTSQSRSPIAGLTGAAIAVQGGLDAINGAEWMKVVYGILLSTLLGFGLGWLNYKLIGRLCRHVNRQKANSFFKWAQICSGAGVAFMQWRPRRPEVHVHLHAGHHDDRRHGHGSYGRGDAHVAHALLRLQHGPRYGRGRRAHHQVRGHGHGEARGVPGIRRQPLHLREPHARHLRGLAGLHDAYQHDGHHGRGGREETPNP